MNESITECQGTFRQRETGLFSYDTFAIDQTSPKFTAVVARVPQQPAYLAPLRGVIE